MVITTTAIGFSLLSLGLAFCGLRFFRAFQKIGGSQAGRKIGILLSGAFLSHAIALGMLAIGAFFFTRNSEILYMLLVVSDLFLTLTGVLLAYTVFYIFFPSVSPWPATIAAFALGMTVVISTIMTHPEPFLSTGEEIDWNMPHLVETFLGSLLFINIGAPFIIFVHSFLQAKSREVKVVSLIIVFLALMGIVNIFTRFMVPGLSNFSRTRISDIMLVIIGFIFIGVFLLPPIIIGLLSKARD